MNEGGLESLAAWLFGVVVFLVLTSQAGRAARSRALHDSGEREEAGFFWKKMLAFAIVLLVWMSNGWSACEPPAP